MRSLTEHRLPLQEVRIPCGAAALYGDLGLPADAAGLVLFAHGSGSDRHSGRNRLVARRLQQAGIATLLFDLLTAHEQEVDGRACQHRFDIALLTRRLEDATTWARRQPALSGLPIGYFGASTGAAAALIAAAQLASKVTAVVARGGRVDLVGPAVLAAVRAPTLLIAGGADPQVLRANEQALARLQAPARLEVVPGAGHLFEQAGALDRVGALSADWFARHLQPAAQMA